MMTAFLCFCQPLLGVSIYASAQRLTNFISLFQHLSACRKNGSIIYLFEFLLPRGAAAITENTHTGKINAAFISKGSKCKTGAVLL